MSNVEAGEMFHTWIVTRGKFLYEKYTREWVRKADGDYRFAERLGRGQEQFHDQRCFGCQ
jgi:hypothetical protein